MLTPAQYQLLKTAILADSQFSAIPLNADGASAIADILNQVASPDFIVWKTFLKESDITSIVSIESTAWSWVTYKSQSVSEQNCWARMFNGTYSVNPSLANVRNAFSDIFSGAGGAQVAQRAHLLAVSKRKASYIEKILATGTGSTAVPATMGFDGVISYQDVEIARAT